MLDVNLLSIFCDGKVRSVLFKALYGRIMFVGKFILAFQVVE